MRRVLSCVIAISLVMCVSVAMFTVGAEDTSIPVNGLYQDGATSAERISTDITWGSMEFTYTAPSQGTWNPADHTYVDKAQGFWQAEGNTVTVVNHSNVAVTAGFSFAKDNGISTALTGSFAGTSTVGGRAITNGSVLLNAGVENQYAAADKVVATLTLEGSLPKNTNGKVGTITVSIAGNAANNAVAPSAPTNSYAVGNTVMHNEKEWVVLEINGSEATLIGKTAASDTLGNIKNNNIIYANKVQIEQVKEYITAAEGTPYLCGTINLNGESQLGTLENGTFTVENIPIDASNPVEYFPITTVTI